MTTAPPEPTAELELFSYPTCPYAQRTRVVLLEKKLPFELIEVDLYDRPDWWATLSPYGKVPLLRHNGRIVYESAIINEYLDEQFPDHPLMPADAYQRAQARIWIDYCDSRFMPACHQLIQDRKDAEKQTANRDRLDEIFDRMENALAIQGADPFWMGSELSLVDLQFAPFFERFGCYQRLWEARWPEQCTRLRRWFEAINQVESYATTSNDVDFHLKYYKKYDEAA